MEWTADFETNNSETECRVWSWGLCCIDNFIYFDGNSIETFIETVKQLSYEENTKIWFHNLAFDGSFILNYLFRKGYCWIEEKKYLSNNQFTTLISDMGQWYDITIRFAGVEKSGFVTINDSMKVLPFSVSNVAKSFGLEESKGSIDYDIIRPIGYIPSEDERVYQNTDCLIMAKALHRMHEEGMKKITAGSNALSYYKSIVKKDKFEQWFPEIDCDEYIRKSYRGGWTYSNPVFRNKHVGKGIVLDVNSLYPSRMRYELLPYGTPTFFTGRYKDDPDHPLYVQRLSCSFEAINNKLPTVQLKGTSRFLDTEYLTSSNGEIVELTMTNIDLELFLDHYKVRRLVYHDGYKFKAQYGMFDEYVDYWIAQKIESEKNGDRAGRTLAKLYQNSLYGKFAKRPKGQSKIPYLSEEGILKFKLSDEEDRGQLYIPIGTFITAYARRYTITAAQKNYKRFMYADTDSLHLLGTEMPNDIEVDKYKLGAWKHESTFDEAVYIGSKCYIENEVHSSDEIEKYLTENPEKLPLVNKDRGTILKITCAGLPEKLHPYVTLDNFAVGLTIQGKLKPKQVPGGVMLVKTSFEIKPRKKSKNVSRETLI